jgi:hypothetical protein
MEGLVHLQKQNKRAIQDLFIFSFQHREKEIPETDLARLSESFKIKPEQAYEVSIHSSHSQHLLDILSLRCANRLNS